MQPSRVAILGTGLIGASVGLAIKAARPTAQVVGYDASGDHLRRAQQVKAIDRRGSLRDALADAELVIISTPVGAMRGLFESIGDVPRRVLLVDDVLTTGATAAASAEQLVAAGARQVSLLTAARAASGAMADLYSRRGLVSGSVVARGVAPR